MILIASLETSEFWWSTGVVMDGLHQNGHERGEPSAEGLTVQLVFVEAEHGPSHTSKAIDLIIGAAERSLSSADATEESD